MNIVVVRLIGGLGNQMFQYAAGRALALRCGAALKLDTSGFARPGTDTPRHYELDAFPISASIATAEDLACFGLPQRPLPRWRRALRRLLPEMAKASGCGVYRERSFGFDPGLGHLRPPLYLDGYWQSEKYFADCADVLRREFTPQAPLEPANAALAARIDQVNAVSLHVRRGDYVSDPKTSRYHGTCSIDYFCRAVDYVAARVADPHLFVFSDDREWATANLRLPIPTTVVDVNPPDRGYRDMQLMARCRHHVLANSSFSWWGAWLDPSPDKIVVAPHRWFAVADAESEDRLPQAWVRV